MKKFIVAAVAAALTMVGLGSCGSSQPTAYAPAAYGQNGYCYYINSPAEAVALQASGLCPHSWVPLLAPLMWQQMYYPYYSSPAYYNHYVPVSVRTVYVSHERSFGSTYRSRISTLSKTASYRGSNGKVTTYNKISTGGGTRTTFGTKTSTRCDVIRPALLKSKFQRGGGGGGGFGGGSRSSGGGYSGGSRSGSSSTSRSGSSSGSRSSC